MSIVYSKYHNCSCDPFWDIGRLNNGIFHIFRGFFLQVWVDVQTGMKASTFLIFMSVTYMYMNIVYNKYENCSYYSFWDISGQSKFFFKYYSLFWQVLSYIAIRRTENTILIFWSVTHMIMNIVYNKYENCSYHPFWDNKKSKYANF